MYLWKEKLQQWPQRCIGFQLDGGSLNNDIRNASTLERCTCLRRFFRCSPKFFGIVCPSPSLLGALLVLCFRAMQERSFELYFSVYIFTCTFVSFTCGISVLVCSAVILSLQGDCTASEVRGYGFDFTEHWHSHTLSYHLLKD